MSGQLIFRYTIDGDDFTRAGEASSSVKNKLKMLGLSADVTRRVAIAMYEGEIYMVIHADGGEITVTVSDSEITMVLADTGPGIPDVEKAMQEGYSTAREEVRSLGFGILFRVISNDSSVQSIRFTRLRGGHGAPQYETIHR